MHPAVAAALTHTPVVALLGQRPCASGKSTLVKTFAQEFTYVSLDDKTVLATARYASTGFVAGLTHHTIINEVQRAPGILRVIKLVVDQKRQPGAFLLTGAANLLPLPTAKRLSTLIILGHLTIRINGRASRTEAGVDYD
jgi:predicted AAA+ superfamily ATPase